MAPAMLQCSMAFAPTGTVGENWLSCPGALVCVHMNAMGTDHCCISCVIPTLPVTPAQLMRSGVGQIMSCALGDYKI